MIKPLSAQPVSVAPAFAGKEAHAVKNNFSVRDTFAPSAVQFSATTPATDRKQSILLPPQSIVVLVPGLGAPASTMQYLYDDFKQRGHRPYVVQVPQILSAQRIPDASAWLAGEIDTIRLKEAKPKLEALYQLMSQPDLPGETSGQIDAQRDAALKDYFGLDDSPLGTVTLAMTKQLLMDTGFVKDVIGLSNLPEYSTLSMPLLNRALAKLPPGVQQSAAFVESHIENRLNEWRNKPPERRLSRVLEKYRAAFIAGLDQADPIDKNVADGLLKHEKIANAVFDKLVPRVALMGHSMGGAVTYKTLQDAADQNNAIFASYSLSSPVDGMWHKMPYMQTPLTALYPATSDVMANSPVMREMRGTQVPGDTTAISLCNPADGTVKPKSTRLNEDLPATLNLTVSPRKAGLLSLMDDRIQRTVNAIPPLQKAVQLVTHSWMLDDTSGHCGLLVNTEEIWAPGAELDKHLLEDDEAPQRLARLLSPHNNESVQRGVLAGLIAHLSENPAEAGRFAALKPELTQLAEMNLPFEGCASQLAQQALVELSVPDMQAVPAEG